MGRFQLKSDHNRDFYTISLDHRDLIFLVCFMMFDIADFLTLRVFCNLSTNIGELKYSYFINTTNGVLW